jgi:transglutaminase-like putative cysteine protease
VRPDGALKIDARTFLGLQYKVISLVPQPDIAVLASDNGRLSLLFAIAAAQGDFALQAEDPPRIATLRVEDRDRLTDVSRLEDEDEQILREFARMITAPTETSFEQAVLLEDFFRDPSHFAYSTLVESGHSAEGLAAWLLDPESPDYREGYSKQFAASMAILARTLNIPARVILGFAPGEVAADGTVTVLSSDTHAWVELWFDTQGWVRFDPTPRSEGDNPPLSASLGFDPSDIVMEDAMTGK